MAKADAQQAVDDQMVMTSLRISKDQARSLEIVSSITGRTKADVVRDALDRMFAELTTPESLDALMEAHRERLLMQQEELRERNAKLAADKEPADKAAAANKENAARASDEVALMTH